MTPAEWDIIQALANVSMNRRADVATISAMLKIGEWSQENLFPEATARHLKAMVKRYRRALPVEILVLAALRWGP